MNGFVPILVMMILPGVFALAVVGLSAIVGPKRYNRAKLDSYECGLQPTPQAEGGGRFPVKYFLVGMSFIVFDIEVIFLYPYAVAFGQLGLYGLVAVLAFIGTIAVPFVYEWRRGGFDWV